MVRFDPSALKTIEFGELTRMQRKKADAEGVKTQRLTTPSVAQRQVILYLHGGGCATGSFKTHQEGASRIARAAKALLSARANYVSTEKEVNNEE